MYDTFYRRTLFPLLSRAAGRRTHIYLADAMRSQFWPPERLEALQLDELRALVDHAHRTCSYYRDAWAGAGLTADGLGSLDDFTRWPVLRRADVAGDTEGLTSTLSYEVTRSSTGGSTGEPLHFVFDRDSAQRRAAMHHRAYGWAGGFPGRKALYLWGTHLGAQRGWRGLKDDLVQRTKRRRILSCFELSEQDMLRYLQVLNRYRPQVLVAYTNPLYELSRFLESRGEDVWSPASIIVGAERLYDFQREHIEETFHAPVFETYGSREFLMIASECDRHEGLHISSENLLVEILDETGRPVGEGVEGNVAITDLHNYAMPFIRFLNGDRAVRTHRRCSCGRGLPLLEGIRGRTLDMIHTPDGRRLPGEFFPHLAKEYAKIARFQVVQESLDRIRVCIVASAPFDEHERSDYLGKVRAAAGPELEIDLDFVDDIPLTPTGKLLVVRSEVSR